MIVLTENVHPDALAVLAEVDVVRVLTNPTVLDADIQLGDVRCVLTRSRGQISESLMKQMPNLKVVGRFGVGLDNIDTDAAARRGIPVVFAPGSTTRAVSEMGLLLMLALARKLRALDSSVRAGHWTEREVYEGTELAGKTLGIVGLGDIGRAIGNLGDVLGMNVVAYSRSSRREGWPSLSLEQVLATADVVHICLANTPETKHLIGAAELGVMRPSSLLINIARGAIVDHVALREAIVNNRIGGYGADVWETEPPIFPDELLNHPNVLVTPHVSGLTDRTFKEICLRPAVAAAAILSGGVPDTNCVLPD